MAVTLFYIPIWLYPLLLRSFWEMGIWFMRIGEIVRDAVKYPFLDIKNVMIFGIMIFVGFFIGLTSLFFNGYLFRIIQSSLEGGTEPPEFNNWIRMLIDGIKVYLVCLGYTLPLLIIIIFGIVLITSFHLLPTTPSYFGSFSLSTVVLVFFVIAYLIIIIPIIMMAIAYMADNNGEINAAFRFREILNKISTLGWINYIKWFIITVIPVFVITIVASNVVTYFSSIIQLPIERILVAVIAAPLFIYLFRSFSLFYMSGGLGYLECENCGGYYELQPGECPEDFERCECGGKLKHVQILSTNKFDKTDDNNKDNKSSSNFNKRNLMIIIILALGITAISGIIYSMHVLNPTPTNYTLLGSYNANDLSNGSKGINIPQGTKKIKVEYNISWVDPGNLNSNFNLNAYSVYIGEGETTGMLNMVADKNIKLKKEQNKTGTYYFNKPPVKSIILYGYGIQGTVNIYTSR